MRVLLNFAFSWGSPDQRDPPGEGPVREDPDPGPRERPPGGRARMPRQGDPSRVVPRNNRPCPLRPEPSESACQKQWPGPRVLSMLRRTGSRPSPPLRPGPQRSWPFAAVMVELALLLCRAPGVGAFCVHASVMLWCRTFKLSSFSLSPCCSTC